VLLNSSAQCSGIVTEIEANNRLYLWYRIGIVETRNVGSADHIWRHPVTCSVEAVIKSALWHCI